MEVPKDQMSTLLDCGLYNSTQMLLDSKHEAANAYVDAGHCYKKTNSTALKGSGGSKTGVFEGVEASIIYVRFKAAASELKPVLEEIERRSSRKEYVQILSECHRIYCEQRLSLVKGIVSQRITEYSKKETLPSLTRSGCAYLMQVCQLEHQLFGHFFPSTSEDISSLAPLVDPLCTFLYDTLRPKLIHETNLDVLCELVDILKIEVIGEQLSRRSESLAGIRPTLDRILNG